ncbi:MAG: histidinol-phosphate aminotransferase, partial [Fimbriimonadaceae bacterium]|nr:histidinol-phosphate aminotransferase [Fimbriimonadaceae bacterium]
PSPFAVEAVKQAAREMHLYPDGAAFELRRALSEHHGVPMEQIVAGDGSDELIHMLGLSLLGSEDDEVVMGEPSFVRYAAAAYLAPSRLIKVPLDAEQRHDLPAMAKAFSGRTKLVFIANPNNPTGTAVTRAELERFIDQLPPQATLVLDEAYHEFASAYFADYPSSQDYLSRGNVVGLRTFSKAYGLAGLRVGFGFFPEWLSDAVERTRAPFNVNSLAQFAGIAALKDVAHLRKTLEGTRRGIDRLTAAFEHVGARVPPSYANFVWADLGQPSRPVYEALLEKGVIVRPGDVLGNANALRVSVGTDEEMDVFEQAFFSVLKEAVAR